MLIFKAASQIKISHSTIILTIKSVLTYTKIILLSNMKPADKKEKAKRIVLCNIFHSFFWAHLAKRKT